ncbi:MAG: PAS domain-containing protein [Alphaproteobacteria bacterium]|nr:PAS domain-containing protein [Alphaproteobacteria bacterium]
MKNNITPEQLFAKLDEAWTEARGPHALPRRADINPVKLGSALQYVSLLDVVPGNPPDFRYRLIGQQLIRAYGRNITGELHSANFEKAPVRPFYDAYVRCAATKAAQQMSADFRNFNGTPCRAQARVWPLSDDGETVTGLLGGCLYLGLEVG